jgi:sulfonate transport system substrate-binding protein
MNIRIGGVPEHFNLLWEMALDQHVFANAGIDPDWTYFAGGTGAMTKALARGDLDMAILLTEGFISAVHQGLKALVVKVYIDSPLPWGIHTGAKNDIETLNDARPYQYAISRLGSGSHLMALIHAQQRNRQVQPGQLCVVNSLDGAVDALENGTCDLFYWEPFMTRPFVNEGRVRKIGDFKAPWSSFLIVATEQALHEKRAAIRFVLETMNTFAVNTVAESRMLNLLTRRFSMTETEAQQWLKETKWNFNFEADLELLVNARNALTRIGACDKSLRVEHLCADWIQLKTE